MRGKIPSVPRRKHPPHPQVKPDSSKHSCSIARWNWWVTFENFLKEQIRWQSMKQLGGSQLYHRSWNLNLTGFVFGKYSFNVYSLYSQIWDLQTSIVRNFLSQLWGGRLCRAARPEIRRRLKMPARRRERVMFGCFDICPPKDWRRSSDKGPFWRKINHLLTIICGKMIFFLS